TGPTYPQRLQAEVNGQKLRFKLIRSETTTTQARVAMPDPGAAVSGEVVYRRFPTQEPWTRMALQPETRQGVAERAAYMPIQPAAGKLEYHLELTTPGGSQRLPAQGEVRLRYKDPVPAPLLISHVVLMFFGVLVGLRAGLGAIFSAQALKAMAWTTLGLLTVGGMILGPLVQKHAFGALWTGWPYGYDLTDNKTLLMWLVWVVACLFVSERRPTRSRWAVGLASLAMVLVYVIPHSTRGSQLDYSKVESGVDAKKAIGTGK
ncbi:MAG: hypothetical protein LWX11_05790, partial [Firmicutes bacterium]|nr:hypothetical protein [Bacillota bacterium]